MLNLKLNIVMLLLQLSLLLQTVPGLGYVLQHTGNWSIAFGLAAAHNVVGAALWAKWVGDRPLPEDGGEPEGEMKLKAA